MRIVNKLNQMRAWAGLGTLIGRGGSGTLHLCRLLKSMHVAGLPTIDLKAALEHVQPGWGAADRKIVMRAAGLGGGSGSTAELAAISAFVAAKQPKQILEFGTFDGASAWHLLHNAPDDARVTTLDLPANTKVAGSTDAGLQGVTARPYLPQSDRVRLIEIDSRQWQPAIDGGADLCFIDAGHSYECVKSDTEKALQVTNPGALILWHDATWQKDDYGVNRYLRDFVAAGRDVRHVITGPYDYSGLAMLIV